MGLFQLNPTSLSESKFENVNVNFFRVCLYFDELIYTVTSGAYQLKELARTNI